MDNVVTRQVLWTISVRILLIFAGFISSIITARALGPEGRGIFFYWTTLAAIAIQFGNLGLHSSNTYYLAKGKAKLSTLAANSLWVSLIAGIFLCGVLVCIVWYRENNLEDVLPFLIPTLIIVPTGLYFLLGSNLLIALDRIGEFNCFELANRYIGLGILLLAVWIWHTPQSLIIAIALSSVLMCVPLFKRVNVLGGTGSPSLRILFEGFWYALRAYLASIFGFLVLRLNVVMLEEFADTTVLGVWSIAAQLLDLIFVIPSAIALVLLPKLMRTNNPYRMMISHLLLVLVLLLCGCFIIVLFGQYFIESIYGVEFKGAYNMLLWAIPCVISMGMISIISQYLAVKGIPILLIWVWTLGFLFELVIAFWLVPQSGGIGAMISLSASYLLVLIGLAAIVKWVPNIID